jgi:hypothetical protein
MPIYTLSNTQERYLNSANPPVLDKVVFTIDHIHAGNFEISSTYEVVKFLTDAGIPVTVFFQVTNPSHNYEFDRNNARLIYGLAPHLVTLGVHPLPKGNTAAKQLEVFNVISGIIKDVTGKKPLVLSYHGSGAGPMSGIIFSGIKYARGIGSAWAQGGDDRLNTPVMVMNSIKRSFDYTIERNAAALSSTLFVHTQELAPNLLKKSIFDTYVKEVIARRLQAVPYYEAMLADFKDSPSEPPEPPTTGSVAKGSLRLSASEKVTRRPLKADFKIQTLNGNIVETANHVTTQQFRIPVGKYRVSATALGKTESKDIELTKLQGLHKIFLIPVSSTGEPSIPIPPTNTGALGSLRLSASEKGTRRPVIADFLIQDLANREIARTSATKSELFRLPPNRYQVSAIVDGVSISSEITLTSTQGIHHIFLVSPASGGGTTSPPTQPPTTPPPSSVAKASLRLSASEKSTRRPLKADFVIEDMNGKQIDSASGVTNLFRIPAGQYRIKATWKGKVASSTIDLKLTMGLHHIFLIPA